MSIKIKSFPIWSVAPPVVLVLLVLSATNPVPVGAQAQLPILALQGQVGPRTEGGPSTPESERCCKVRIFVTGQVTQRIDFEIGSASGDLQPPVTLDFDQAMFVEGAAPCANDVGDYDSTKRTGSFVPGGATFMDFSFPSCGDSRSEKDERFAVGLGIASGNATPDPNHVTAILTIHDDDNIALPQITIGSLQQHEGTMKNPSGPGFLTTKFIFPVSLTRPFQQTITVPYTVLDNTAHRSLCSTFFQPSSRYDFGQPAPQPQTLQFAPYATETSITVPVCADAFNEPNETFSVRLGTPTPAIATVGSPAVGTILNDDSGAGTFRLAPHRANVRAGKAITYKLRWTVPKPRNWRALSTVDLRLLDGRSTAIWVRWAQMTNSFRVVDPSGRLRGNASRPGEAVRLPGRLANLNLATSTVKGSGPHGRSVTLTLDVDLKNAAAGHTLRLQAAGTDDLGHSDAFRNAGVLAVR